MDYLKKLRIAKGVSQQSVAEYLEITRQAYSNYENGNRAPDTETLLKLAEYFEVTVDTLLRGSDAGTSSTPIELDDFTYAMHNASNELSEADKNLLIEMADRLRKLTQK